MNTKLILSTIATAIAVGSYIPYIRDIRHGKTKPHAFSWLIWALLGFIAGIAQISAGGGVGAMVVLVTAVISLWIAFIAYRARSVHITASDWASLIAALAAIPAWLITNQPLTSVVIVSAIDLLGFWPTIRKSYHSPQHETVSTYVSSAVKHCLTVAAQQKYNWTTVLYPGSLALVTIGFVAMLLVRKRGS